VEPAEFTRTRLPFEGFESVDLLKEHIPEPFLCQLNLRQKLLSDWRSLLNLLSTGEEKNAAEKHVAKEFETWLRQTGHSAELTGLKTLKSNLATNSDQSLFAHRQDIVPELST
jgi:hypothetical protein